MIQSVNDGWNWQTQVLGSTGREGAGEVENDGDSDDAASIASSAKMAQQGALPSFVGNVLDVSA